MHCVTQCMPATLCAQGSVCVCSGVSVIPECGCVFRCVHLCFPVCVCVNLSVCVHENLCVCDCVFKYLAVHVCVPECGCVSGFLVAGTCVSSAVPEGVSLVSRGPNSRAGSSGQALSGER